MKVIALPVTEFRNNPYPFYQKLRDEYPVQKIKLKGNKEAWFITRYDDALSVLKSEHFVKNTLNAPKPNKTPQKEWVPAFIKPIMQNMLDLDAPDHSRLKKLVHKGFTPHKIEEMRGRIQVLSSTLLDQAEVDGKMDIINDYALPIPTTIIAEMLGVPKKDMPKFHHWSRAIVSVESASPSPWELVKTIPKLYAFLKYIRQIIKDRRIEPREDLISDLVQIEEEGDRLNEDELVAMIFLLIVAGHETTVNLIGNGILALISHPDQMSLLKDNTDMVTPAIEEMLRFEGPLKLATERYSAKEVTIGDTIIPQGELVYVVLGSANRDERHFSNPGKLDISRSPNRHLAFGQGIHYCLGAPLARMEGQIALTTFLNRFNNIKLALTPDKLLWKKGLVLRGLESLPVTLR